MQKKLHFIFLLSFYLCFHYCFALATSTLKLLTIETCAKVADSEVWTLDLLFLSFNEAKYFVFKGEN